jgi:CTP:molybdopterin cytidylyltransferase MocA
VSTAPGPTGETLRVAAVVLAAGASRRLGRSKQLVEIDGRPLVRRIAEAALAAGCAPLAVVLGAEADAVSRALGGLAAVLVRNEGFEEGLASSIRVGVAAARDATPRCDGALLLLVDQPRVDASVLRRLLARFGEGRGKRIAVCAYGGGVGVPAVFPRGRFDALAALRGDRGAKGLLESERERLLEVPFPGGALDLDTPDDLARLGADPDAGAPW